MSIRFERGVGRYAPVQTFEITFPNAFIEVCKLLKVQPVEVTDAALAFITDPFQVAHRITVRSFQSGYIFKPNMETFGVREIEEMVMEIYTIDTIGSLGLAGDTSYEEWRRKYSGIIIKG